MKPLSLEPELAKLPLRPINEMGLKELERIRLILRGGSVIDWRRLHFGSRDEVDRFLRLCQIDTTRPSDEAWVRLVLAEAVEHLRTTFNYRVTDAVAEPEEIHDLFLFASGAKGSPRHRRIACIVLKLMHVIQHVEGRDLLFRLSVSESDVCELAVAKVMGIADEMRQEGLPIVEFADSIKSRASIITKLLAKKETVAAQVYDKIRFRIVTRSYDDIVPVLYFLSQRLFPFNFVVPGETENTLISFRSLVERYPNFAHLANQLHLDPLYEDRERRDGNAFSGGGYRALNFVVDLPMRMDAFLPAPEDDYRPRKGRIAFVLCEFQIMDEETARENDLGENAHERYKRRQRRRVLRRLSRGLVVPKRK